jgi:hypothetical protein
MDLAFAVAHAIVPLSFLTIWFTSVAWAYEDARRRSDPRLVRIAVGAAIAVPLVGAAVYALLRPCRVRADERERRVWRLYLESQLEPGERLSRVPDAAAAGVPLLSRLRRRPQDDLPALRRVVADRLGGLPGVPAAGGADPARARSGLTDCGDGRRRPSAPGGDGIRARRGAARGGARRALGVGRA